jgi:GNAT superfamily N-acetyltransferase
MEETGSILNKGSGRMKAVRVKEHWQLAGVHYVRTETMVKGFHIPLDKEFDEGDLKQYSYVLVLDDIYPVAACRIHFPGEGGTAKIERVSVLKEYRKKGVGRLLIEEAENWIRESGVKKICITSRDEAVGFYEALGYKADYGRKMDAGVFKIIYTEKIWKE